MSVLAHAEIYGRFPCNDYLCVERVKKARKKILFVKKTTGGLVQNALKVIRELTEFDRLYTIDLPFV